MINWLMISSAEPKAMVVKWALSLNEFLTEPSATLEDTKTDALFN